MPRPRWQRNPRADGPAPRSAQEGHRVLRPAAVLRGLAGSREGRDNTRVVFGIPPHAKAVRRPGAGHGPDGSATLGLCLASRTAPRNEKITLVI